MSGLILVCLRDPQSTALSVTDVERCVAAIAPDNLHPNPTTTYGQGGLVVAVTNPVASVRRQDGCVCLGGFFGPEGRWHEPLTSPPDGSYALCRHDERYVQLVTDVVASRTLWYVLTERAFLASSSQRALVALLGDFQPSDETVSWMMTSGHLGPGLSWDRRLRRVPSLSRVTLDRQTWRLDTRTEEIEIRPDSGSESEHIERLRVALLETCANLDLPLSEWLLPLSGGLDSRAILLAMVEAGKRPRCVTWGVRSSLDDPQNDALIASQVAASQGVEHTFYETSSSTVQVREALARFLRVGEGRTTDFAGYADGLAMWSHFFDSGVTGVIRGDDNGMGYYYTDFRSDLQVRRRIRELHVADYPPTHAMHRLGLAPQSTPDALTRRQGESLRAFSSRHWEQFGFPATLSPLNDLKSAYVEVLNPLLSRRIVTVVHHLPTSLSQQRKSLKAVAKMLGPRIPFARHDALMPSAQYLNTAAFRAELRRGLSSPAASVVFPERALDTLLSGMDALVEPQLRQGVERLKQRLKHALPQLWAERLSSMLSVGLPSLDLAFRAYVVAGMRQLLDDDAKALQRSREAVR